MDLGAWEAEFEAARLEERGTAPTVTYGDREFTLPVLTPWSMLEVAVAFDRQRIDPSFSGPTDIQIVQAVRDLLGDQYDDFIAMSPSSGAVIHLITAIGEVYRVPDPKSEPSSGPSEKGSARSKPRGKRSTKGT